MVERIKRGLVGLVKAAGAAIGINPVPQTMLERRVRACLGHGTAQPRCEHAGRGWFCAKCGCIIQAKLRVKSEECPAGKWEAAEEKDEGGRMKDERRLESSNPQPLESSRDQQ